MIVAAAVAPPMYASSALISLSNGAGSVYDDPQKASAMLVSVEFLHRALPWVRELPTVRAEPLGRTLIRLTVQGDSPVLTHKWAEQLASQFVKESNALLEKRRRELSLEVRSLLTVTAYASEGKRVEALGRYFTASNDLAALREAKVVVVNPPRKLSWWQRIFSR